MNNETLLKKMIFMAYNVAMMVTLLLIFSDLLPVELSHREIYLIAGVSGTLIAIFSIVLGRWKGARRSRSH